MKLLVFRLDKQEAVTPLPSPAGTRRRGLSLAGRWGAAGAQRWPRQPPGSPPARGAALDAGSGCFVS